jgi:hypothetical protein
MGSFAGASAERRSPVNSACSACCPPPRRKRRERCRPPSPPARPLVCREPMADSASIASRVAPVNTRWGCRGPGALAAGSGGAHVWHAGCSSLPPESEPNRRRLAPLARERLCTASTLSPAAWTTIKMREQCAGGARAAWRRILNGGTSTHLLPAPTRAPAARCCRSKVELLVLTSLTRGCVGCRPPSSLFRLVTPPNGAACLRLSRVAAASLD